MEKYLTEKEASRLYSLSISWFQRKRWDGTGPPFRKIGKAVRYPAGALSKWFARHRLRTKSSGQAHDTRSAG